MCRCVYMYLCKHVACKGFLVAWWQHKESSEWKFLFSQKKLLEKFRTGGAHKTLTNSREFHLCMSPVVAINTRKWCVCVNAIQHTAAVATAAAIIVDILAFAWTRSLINAYFCANIHTHTVTRSLYVCAFAC